MTIADAIAMTTPGDTYYRDKRPLLDGPAQFSPDGKRFLILLKRGKVDTNTVEYFLYLWTAENGADVDRPEELLTMSSSTNQPAIEQINWQADNQTILFLGHRARERQQLYSFNIHNHVLTKLTDHPTNLIAYSATPTLTQIAYTAEAQPSDVLQEMQGSREGLVVTNQSLYELLGLHDIGGDPELFVMLKGAPARRLSLLGRIADDPYFRPMLSPDGRFIAIMTILDDPSSEGVTGYAPGVRPFAVPGLNYRLIDIGTGQMRSILDSPADIYPNAVWSPDGQTIFLSGVFLPLGNTTAEERRIRSSRSFTVEVSVSSGAFSIVTGDRLRLKGLDSTPGRLVFLESKTGAHSFDVQVLMAKKGDRWTRLPENGESQGRGLHVVVEEDIRTAPKVYLEDYEHKHRKLLLDLNPSFKQLELGRVEEITFATKDGRRLRAGLFYPVGYKAGERYPLVIQTHGWWGTERFYVDGPFTSAFAAQPLAGKGIMVVQVGEDLSEYAETDQEARRAMLTYEGVIDYLDAQKLVDRSRVGIIAFSRTCLYVKFTLTHSKYHFAAAAVQDGIDAGYVPYILNFNAPGFASSFEGINAGRPFGQGLKSWIRNSPGFNIEKVHTPLRIVAPSPDVVLQEWEWFAALSVMHRAVELVVMKDGAHELEKPWERLVSQDGNVDWFTFWLKGEESADPNKNDQNRRWRSMRWQSQ